VAEHQPLQPDGELHVARPHHVLDLELHELGGEAELLYNPGVLPGGQSRVLLALGASAHHLAGGEDERRGAGLADAHDDGREALGVVLRVARLQRYLLQVQRAAQVDCGHDVLQQRCDAGGCLHGHGGGGVCGSGHGSVGVLVAGGGHQGGRSVGLHKALRCQAASEGAERLMVLHQLMRVLEVLLLLLVVLLLLLMVLLLLLMVLLLLLMREVVLLLLRRGEDHLVLARVRHGRVHAGDAEAGGGQHVVHACCLVNIL